MRAEERFVAGDPHAGESATAFPPGGLLSLIDAIEQKLALARQVLEANGRAVSAMSAPKALARDLDNAARPARQARDPIGAFGPRPSAIARCTPRDPAGPLPGGSDDVQVRR